MQRCESEYCGKTFINMSEKLTRKALKEHKMTKRAIDKHIKEALTKNKQNKRGLKKYCMNYYCNPDCKNTMYEARKRASSALIKRFQKKAFGNRKDVLKNSFYNKLPAKNVTRAKKQGALSGCADMILT